MPLPQLLLPLQRPHLRLLQRLRRHPHLLHHLRQLLPLVVRMRQASTAILFSADLITDNLFSCGPTLTIPAIRTLPTRLNLITIMLYATKHPPPAPISTTALNLLSRSSQIKLAMDMSSRVPMKSGRGDLIDCFSGCAGSQ